MADFNFSYSLLNNFKKYLAKQMCGELFLQCNIRKNFEQPTGEAANAGQWFEFITMGTLPRNNIEPSPDRTAKGELAAKLYKPLQGQATKNFPEVYADLKIIEKGKLLEFEFEGFNFKMIYDVVTQAGVSIQVRDIKTTGKLYDEWEETGWGNGTRKPLREKPMMLQCFMYVWGWWKQYQEIPEFYFDVFSNTNDKDFEVFFIQLSEDDLLFFESTLLQLCRDLRAEYMAGFIPRPEFKKCRLCKEYTNKKGENLYDACTYKALKPEAITIQIIEAKA